MIGIKSKRRKGATKGLQRVVGGVIGALVGLGIGIFILATLVNSITVDSTNPLYNLWNTFWGTNVQSIIGILVALFVVSVAILMYAYVNRANQGATGGGIV